MRSPRTTLTEEDLELIRECLDEAEPDRERAMSHPLSKRYQANPEALRGAPRRDLDGRPTLVALPGGRRL